MPASSTVPEEFALLVSAFAAITDPRLARGKVHPLPGVLALVVLGLMAGCRSLSAVSRYGQMHPEVLAPLGLRRSPSVATLHRLLRRVAVAEVRTALAAFARHLAATRTGRPAVGVVAIDGKTLRGVWEDGEQLHVLHVFAHRSALALDQVAVGCALDETPAVHDWLGQVADTFPGLTILTGDALYVEQDLCAAVVAGGRDYLLRLKKTKAPSTPTSPSSLPPRLAPQRPSR
jgi:DDE_Tnp_1-associated